MSTRKTHIYVLSDGEYYYIGKADNVEKRYHLHLRSSFKENHPNYWSKKSKWFRSYASKEEAKKWIKIIDIIEVPYHEWQDLEIELIASYRRNFGEEFVTNEADGGEGGAISKGENNGRSKLTWESVQYIRENYPRLSREELASLFNMESSSQIGKVLRNDAWYDPEYQPPEMSHLRGRNQSGENNANGRLNWYEVFLFRMSYRPYGKGKHSKIYAFSRLGVSLSSLDKISRNLNWYDENWDHKNKRYIGKPQGWEESWGSWG